ncbi:hypothetical protein RLE37_09995, partial [Streptococcus pneumoniae]|nr:hypothetical protein [Streptococcus pneumoniae]
MGLFFYNKIGSIISIVDLPTTNIIEPEKRHSHMSWRFFYAHISGQIIGKFRLFQLKWKKKDWSILW